MSWQILLRVFHFRGEFRVIVYDQNIIFVLFLPVYCMVLLLLPTLTKGEDCDASIVLTDPFGSISFQGWVNKSTHVQCVSHSVTRALQRFLPISKTTFWWTSIKCIHDNNGERNFRNHYFNVNSQSTRVALSSLLDSSVNRNWEVVLIKV